MKGRILAVLLACAIATQAAPAAGQTRINTAFTQVTGDTEALSWALHGDTRLELETGSCLPNMDRGRLELEGRAAIGHTRQDGEFIKTVDRLTGRALYSSEGQDLNLYAAADVLSEIQSAEAYGSDYTIRISTGLERAVDIGTAQLRGRFGFGVDWDRYQDHNTEDTGLVTAIDLTIPLEGGTITLQTETFRGKDTFTLQHYGTLTARLTGSLIGTLNVNLLKQPERKLRTELLAGVGFAF